MRTTTARAVGISFFSLSILVIALLSMPLVVAQQGSTTPTPTLDPIFQFPVEGEIGRALPRRLVYDAQGEQYAIVDAYNTLTLSDALTYQTRFTLVTKTDIRDLAFSHDGRWLAALNGVDVQLWNTETGELAAQMDFPSDPRALRGPLTFSSGDEVLVFYGDYPAPPELRRTENDRITYPWVWHLPAARGEGASTLPDGAVAALLYDYSNGFTLTPDDRIIAALPSRLRVLNARTLATEYEIPTDRYEQDPLQIWTSVRDNRVYVYSGGSATLLQLDAADGTLSEIPLRRDLPANVLDALELGSLAQPIGIGDLRPALLDEQEFRTLWRAQITLIDVLEPPSNQFSYSSTVPLLYYQSGSTRQFVLADPYSVSQYALSPDATTLVLRQFDDEGDEFVARYDIESGEETGRITPSLRGIGGYDRAGQNRVLAYDKTGATLLSDFQRLDADTLEVLSDDLRYSFQFERFYFGREPGTMVTIAGSEWRVWDIASNTVLRRAVIQEANYVRATSADGYRILTDTGNALGVQDFGTDEFYHLTAPTLPDESSLYLSFMVPNPTWTRLLAVYDDHPSGPYTPGSALAAVGKDNTMTWLIAGDDLPVPLDVYGWLDDDTIYASGPIGVEEYAQARVYDVNYAANGLPQCLLDKFSDNTPEFLARWQRLLLEVRPDKLNAFVLRLCDSLPETAAEAAATLVPTNTPDFRRFPTPTGQVGAAPATALPAAAVPECLLQRYPDETTTYSALWRELSAGLAPEQVQELAALLCQGIGVIPTPDPNAHASVGLFGKVMFIDAETGERGVGVYTEPLPTPDPMIPVRPIYEQFFERPLGTALLSADKELLAVSNLPGELTIFRLDFPYARAGVPLTATAEIVRTRQNLIYPLLENQPTETPQPMGTARPTLTVTPLQTILPRPAQNVLPTLAPGDVQAEVCAAKPLYTIAEPPAGYSPTGRIYAQFSDGPLWMVEPEDGTRAEAPEAPQCTRGLDCEFSPDRAWILAQTYELVYVTRPDNSDQRILWDLRTPNPPTPFPRNLHWSGPDTLEWEGRFSIEADGTPSFTRGIIRDTLNVYPDPAPFIPNIRIDGIKTTFISRQPNGDWAIAAVEYGTGQSYGTRYYLVDTAAAPLVYFPPDDFNSGYGYHDASTVDGSAQLFAQDPVRDLSIEWSPFGDRLYFTFRDAEGKPDRYEMVFPEGIAEASRRRNEERAGEYSPDGRYRAWFGDTTNSGQRLMVNDVVGGSVQSYCLPQTSRNQSSPEGLIVRWSPDSRYVAVQAVMAADGEEHLLVVDRETREVVDLSAGVYQLITWAKEPGSYSDDGTVATPLPTATLSPDTNGNGG